MSQLYCADLLLNRIFCSYGNRVSPLANKPAFTLPILFPIHPDVAPGVNIASSYIPHTTSYCLVFSLLSMPWLVSLMTRGCCFFLPLNQKKVEAWYCSQTTESDFVVCLGVCVCVCVSQISIQTGETLIPRHSCASHPMQVDIFFNANTANETKGCNKAQ